MEKEQKLGLMELNMKENTEMEKKKEKEFSTGVTEQFIMESFH
jgi:hypothetical protein